MHGGSAELVAVCCDIPVRVTRLVAGQDAERKPQTALQGDAHEERVDATKRWPEPAWPANAHGVRPWQGDTADGHRGEQNLALTQKSMRVASEHRGAGRESMRRGCLRGGSAHSSAGIAGFCDLREIMQNPRMGVAHSRHMDPTVSRSVSSLDREGRKSRMRGRHERKEAT
eukprot:108337-Pleurochrysis_carterae.AAC.1